MRRAGVAVEWLGLVQAGTWGVLLWAMHSSLEVW